MDYPQRRPAAVATMATVVGDGGIEEEEEAFSYSVEEIDSCHSERSEWPSRS